MVMLMDTLALYEQFRGTLGEEGAKRVAQTIGAMIEDAKNAATKADVAGLRETIDTNVNRLASALARLAEAQAGTEHRLDRVEAAVERLAEAQTRTEHRLDRVEAAVERLAEAQARTENRLDRVEAAVERLAEAQTRTERAVENLARQVGGLSEAVGANLEDFACELVPELLEKYWGMTILSAGREEIEIKAAPHEFDLVVRGTVADRPVLVLGETKATVTPSEVRRFARLVDTVRAERPRDDIRPLFFGYRANRETQNLIRELGGSMVFTRGVMIPVD